MKSLLLTSLLAFALAVPATHSAVYVHSTFEDSVAGQNGRKQVVTTKDSNLTPWYLLNSNASPSNTNFVVLDDTDEGGLGKAAKLGRTYIAGTSFDEINLKIGETLTISFDYRFLTAPSSGDYYLRIMLYNSGESAPPSADNNGVSGLADYTGYYFGLGVGSDDRSGQTIIRKRNADNTNGIASTSGLTSLASSNNGIVSGTTAHSVVLTLTRNESSNFLQIAVDGQTITSITDTTGIYSNFNSLIFNNQAQSGVSLNLDNIVLSVIPEPGTVSLSILGVGALFYGVRRTRLARGK